MLDDLLHLIIRLQLTLEDKAELASRVVFDSMSIIISLSDILQCGLLISEELVGEDLLTETRFFDELLFSSVIPREASLYTRYPIVARALGLAAAAECAREQRYLAYKRPPCSCHPVSYHQLLR